MNILAIIPARGGSKGIPHKNIKNLNGKPLIFYTIREAKKSKFLSRIVVSTDDEKISNVSKRYGVDVIKRPKKLAKDTTSSEAVIKHAINYLKKKEGFRADILVLLQPTSPLRKVNDIDNSIKKFLTSNCSCVVTVCETSHTPYWMYKITKNDKLEKLIKNKKVIKRRQDTPIVYQLNGAVYVFHAKKIMKDQSIVSGDVRAYVMPYERSIDTDQPFDLFICEMILTNWKRYQRGLK